MNQSILMSRNCDNAWQFTSTTLFLVPAITCHMSGCQFQSRVRPAARDPSKFWPEHSRNVGGYHVRISFMDFLAKRSFIDNISLEGHICTVQHNALRTRIAKRSSSWAIRPAGPSTLILLWECKAMVQESRYLPGWTLRSETSRVSQLCLLIFLKISDQTRIE